MTTATWIGMSTVAESPPLTEQQASIIAAAEGAAALRHIGEALLSVAEAIRERKTDLGRPPAARRDNHAP